MSKKAEVVEIKGLVVGKLEEPRLPKTWDYEKSLEKLKATIYKWTHLTIEVANELFIARRQLSAQGGKRTSGRKIPLTWTTYCEAIGSSRQVVNTWLRRFFGKSLLEDPGKEEEEPNQEEIHLEKDTLKCLTYFYPTKDRLFGECKIGCTRKPLCKQLADVLVNSPLLIEERKKLENLGFGKKKEKSKIKH